MFQVEKIKRALDCDLCNKVLVDPITIPCGNTICQLHVDELLEKRVKRKKTFFCELCKEEHVVPADGFALNKKMKLQLEIKLNELKLDYGIYKSCKETLKEFKETIAKLESIYEDPANYIFEYFERTKREVDLRRKTLKAEIDDYSTEVLELIESTKLNLIRTSKEVNKLGVDVEISKKELNDLIEQLDTFEIDSNFKTIKKTADILKKKFEKTLLDYKKSLLDNRRYVFTHDKLNIRKIFGSFQLSRDSKRVITLFDY